VGEGPVHRLKGKRKSEEDFMDLTKYEEIIKFAIDKEIEAFTFYTTASQVAKYSGARELFVDFAKEEKKHRELLEGITTEKIAELKLEKPVPNLKISDYMVDLEFKPDLSYADILRLAMKKEERSLKLYTDLKENAAGQEIGKLFDYLAQQESKHKYYLETKYDEDILK
jgi:rubrerythrin